MHKLPADLRQALIVNSTALDAWNDITPLARNEFICWVEDAKQEMTRERRIRRTQEELEDGQRRPCCWPGCGHREHTGNSAPIDQLMPPVDRTRAFTTTLEPLTGNKARVPVPFDPDEAWGKKREHHVNGTVAGMRVRVTIVRDDSGWSFTLSPSRMRTCPVGPGETSRSSSRPRVRSVVT